MKYLSLIWEIPRGLYHLGIATYNYLAHGEFTDER